ncbi:clasp N terminal-domain-containing protein [Mycena alexandri]|uniref:Clasp N terminal-domain-containing protein n=1 Tax=Mycena alexandri TaxID=1745969 RepID=A0AAD6TK68_9AGAR|nr:clasp N terminal-domain-containing protein [Mycena alexandri]
MASTKKINMASASVFEQKFETIRPQLFLPETEETWDAIARGVTALTAACSDTDSYTAAELLVAMRSSSRPLISAMNSERGRLSGVAIDLIAVVASCLGVAFEPLLAHFFPVLLTLSSRTSKVTVARARTCILAVIDATHLPSILPYLMQSVTDKSVSLRLTIVESTLACMNCFNPPDLEKDARAKDIEGIIRGTARDANADVRKVSKKVFEAYKLLLPSRLESFAAPLTPTTRKYLDIQNKAADKLKASHSHLPPPSKANHLSSSTSAMRAPSSRRPPIHTRSASSPAVALDAVVPDERQPRSRAKGDMGPPKLPEAAQPSRQPAVARPAIDRKRIVSMCAAVRPVLPTSKSGEQARPIPVSSNPPTRVDGAPQAAPTTTVVARRVPISEVQLKLDAEKATRARPRIDNSASTPAMRQISIPVPPPPAGGSQPPVSKFARPDKDGASAVVKPKAKEPTKNSWTRPTLSQMSRAKTTERRVPVPAVSKPPPGKTVPRKAPLPSNKGKQAAKPVPQGRPASSASTSSAGAKQEVPVSKEVDEEAEEESRPLSGADIRSSSPETPLIETEEIAKSEDKSEEAQITVTGSPSGSSSPSTPKAEKSSIASSKTPISELLLSIERGFLFTPSAPLSPPQSYIGSANLAIPFPMWESSEQRDEELNETVDKPVEGIRRLEARRALGDVAINK